MKLLSNALPLLLLAADGHHVLAAGSGLIGYGITMYDPACAFACRAAIAPFPLECSVPPGGLNGTDVSHEHGGGPGTSPECRAHDAPFMTTLAWCIAESCVRDRADPVAGWRIERFWSDWCTGDVETKPMWGYAKALAEIKGVPTVVVGGGGHGEEAAHEGDMEEMGMALLNFTAVLDPATVKMHRDTFVAYEYQESLHSLTGIILLAVSVGMPVLLALTAHMPVMGRMLTRLSPYLVTPSIFRGFHVQPLPYLLGHAPTVGQGLLITGFIVLNVVLTAAGYGSTVPGNMWFPLGPWHETMAYVSGRTGVLALALAPLVVLLAGRNDFLLWLTDWPHSTFLLLHRWVARVFGLQVILHSILELMRYRAMGEGVVEAEQALPYWTWGVVATVCVSIMMVAGLFVFRRASYEFFIAVHIVLAVLVLVGSWYHVDLLYERMWGYEIWLYVTFAVWGGDRAARLFRVLKNGLQRAFVVEVAPGILRVDIPGVKWDGGDALGRHGRHVYASFPTVHPFTFWQNHPFSVVPTAVLRAPRRLSMGVAMSSRGVGPMRSSCGGASGRCCSLADTEKAATAITMANLSPRVRDSRHSDDDASSSVSSRGIDMPSAPPPCCAGCVGEAGDSAAGVTLFIRYKKGMTRKLALKASRNHPGATNIPALLDGPYGNSQLLSSSILRCDRLLLICGGIGITGVLGFAGLTNSNVRLCWSLREDHVGLARELEHALARFQERDVSVGSRIDLARVLDEEDAAGWRSIGVVVCGPPGMCDDVRALVAARGRAVGAGGTVWEVEVGAYSW